MKKLISLLLAVSMMISLVACGNQKTGKYCTNCGNGMAASDAFCSECGTAVDGNVAPSSPEETTTSTTSTEETTATTELATTTTAKSTTTTTAKPATTTKKPATTTKKPATTTKKPTTTTTAKPTATTTIKTQHKHSYVNYICSGCGITDPNYLLYKEETKKYTDKYNDDVAQIQEKIDKCNSDLIKAQNALNVAKGELLSLSPSCPPGYINQFVNENLHLYGNSWAATQAAQNAWTNEYNNKRAQYNNIIQIKTSEITSIQTNLSLYSSALTTLKLQYDSDIQKLKDEYGIS